MSALTDLQASVTALGVAVDNIQAKFDALRQQVNTTVPLDEQAITQMKADLDRIIARIHGV